MNTNYDFDEMARAWPNDLVARSEIEEFTSGLIKYGTMANLDSRGEGPEQRVVLGRKVAYPKEALIRWMEFRANNTKGVKYD